MSETTRLRLGSLCALDEATNEQKYHGTHGGNNKTADEAVTQGNAKLAEEEASKEGADHTDDEITNKAETTALDKIAGQPACNKTHNEKPHQIHLLLP